MSTNSPNQTHSSSALALWAGAITFVVSILVLLSINLGSWPWAIQWVKGGVITNDVFFTLDSVRYEIVALLLVSLNLMLFILRRSRAEYNGDQYAGVESSAVDTTNLGQNETINQESVSSDCSSTQRSTADTIDSPSDEAEDSEDGSALLSTLSVSDCAQQNAAQMQIAIDEIARLRTKLSSCEQQLQVATDAKSQFLANMSHELRTPMNGIMGMTDLLLGSALTPREERFVRSISASSTTLLAIINDLLDFSKIESGILRLEHARFSVRDCVEDVCSSLASGAQEKGIELICYIDDSVPTHMEGDPARVRQILNNLISNAIAFTDYGEVVVRINRSDDAVERTNGKTRYVCDVQDTGIGISPEMQLQLFEAFSQGDESSTRGHGGLGMGLAITRQLVALMDGEVSFRSRLGEGSRFSFSMTLEDIESQEDANTKRRSLSGARVLVVDDNETNRTILYHQLSNWGLIVETVASGKLALSSLRAAHDKSQGFDLLVLDLHMPEMDGIQLAKAIQLEPDFKHIQSIMLTSAILQLDGAELERLGVFKYVSKPARQSVLHDSLASLMPYIGSNAGEQRQRPDSDLSKLPTINAHVLLAEDNPVNQDVAMSMLEQLGCSVELASNGTEAVARAKDEKFDIVLMDCQMPIMDGYEATKLVKTAGSVNESTPVIALTANAMEGDREKCLTAGMDDYISKPVRTQTLLLVLDKWVNEVVNDFKESVHSRTPAIHSTGGRDGDLPSYVIDAITRKSEGHPVVHGVDNTEESAESIQSPADSASAVDTQGAVEFINTKALDTIRGLQRPGKPDLLNKVICVYFEKTPQVIADMQEGLREKDYLLVSASAHSLKSSSAYLGADSLSKQCKAVEAAIENQSFSELELLVSSIAADYLHVEVVLKKYTVSSDKAA